MLDVGASGEGEGAAEWRALQHLVRRVSDSVVTSLPAFWKVAKTYMEGRYHKVRFSNALCQNMLLSNEGDNSDPSPAQANATSTFATRWPTKSSCI